MGDHDRPFVLAKRFDNPRNARFLPIYPRECGEAVDAPTNVVQFGANRKEFAFAWPTAIKRLCTVVELDRSRLLARMRAVRVGV